MDNDHLADEEPHYTRRSVGPIALLLPLALSALAISFLRDKPSRELGSRAEPPQHSPDGRVMGWQGSVTTADGSRWSAALRPLHSDPVRLAFDSRALQRHFGLPEGQAFRLVLSDLSNGASTELRELPVSADELVVVDSEGQALSLLADVDEAVPADPLGVLLAAPTQSLAAGGSAVWVLWGRVPGANARISGFASGRDLVLERRSIPSEKVDVALLRRTQ